MRAQTALPARPAASCAVRRVVARSCQWRGGARSRDAGGAWGGAAVASIPRGAAEPAALRTTLRPPSAHSWRCVHGSWSGAVRTHDSTHGFASCTAERKARILLRPCEWPRSKRLGQAVALTAARASRSRPTTRRGWYRVALQVRASSHNRGDPVRVAQMIENARVSPSGARRGSRFGLQRLSVFSDYTELSKSGWADQKVQRGTPERKT
jgi:hypothetical protein